MAVSGAMSLLDGKRILVTGVLTDASLAFGVARLAQEQGAEVVLTGAGRGLSLTQRTARKLPAEADVLELDVTDPAQVAAVRDELGRAVGPGRRRPPRHRLRAAVVPRRRLPRRAVGGRGGGAAGLRLLPEDARRRRGARTCPRGGSIVGLDFDNSTQAWPAYDWMGVAKAALESTRRYLARDLGPQGIRVNLVAAGPIKTLAAKSIPGFPRFEDVWDERSPLGWDVKADADAVARSCVALLSDWFPKTTGEIVHVDGGFHAVAT